MHDIYENPLCGRYASDEMKHLFSDDVKFSTWRKLWIALAEAEKELGLNITDEQIAQMKEHIHDIDYESAAAHEREVRHDVMAHVHTFGEAAPLAKPIIHLGATSCYVGDNTDVIRMRDGLLLIRKLLISAIAALADFAEKHKDLPTLAYTHFQAAQPTTVGKRATLWLNDLMLDLQQLEFQLENLKLLGCKGTTGTQASFMELFDGDEEKCRALDQKIADKMGFASCVPVSGQTYSRKVDFQVLAVLSGIAQSATKFSNDIRLLSHEKEVDEPFETKQIGSSAMAYKRNPMRSERICSLARYVICDLQNAAMTTTGQWFERTLDDSANKRLSVPEAFLATDAILSLYINVISGMRVYPEVIRKHLNEELLQRDLVRMLGRKNDCVHADGLIAIVLHSDLGLSVRAEIIILSFLTDCGELYRKLMRKAGRKRHIFRGLVAGVTEHDSLIARAAQVRLVLFAFLILIGFVDAHGDVA